MIGDLREGDYCSLALLPLHFALICVLNDALFILHSHIPLIDSQPKPQLHVNGKENGKELDILALTIFVPIAYKYQYVFIC